MVEVFMLIIYLTNPVWLTITVFFSVYFFTNMIIAHQRRKTEMSTANQDTEANSMHSTKRASKKLRKVLN